MYKCVLQEFLNNELQYTEQDPIGTQVRPSILTTLVLTGETKEETAAAAGAVLENVFGSLNASNGTDFRYTDYYTCRSNGFFGTGDTIVMIESGFMDSVELRNYIRDSYVHQLVEGVPG